MDNAWHNAWRAVLAVSACILLATACGESTPLVQKDSLEMRELARNFATPPESVQTAVYWYWISGHVSKEGVVKDLYSMKEAGTNRAFIGNIFL